MPNKLYKIDISSWNVKVCIQQSYYKTRSRSELTSKIEKLELCDINYVQCNIVPICVYFTRAFIKGGKVVRGGPRKLPRGRQICMFPWKFFFFLKKQFFS